MSGKNQNLSILATIALAITVVTFYQFSNDSAQNLKRDKIISSINEIQNTNIEFHKRASELGYISDSDNSWSYSSTEYDPSNTTYEYKLYKDGKVFMATGKLNNLNDQSSLEIIPKDYL